MSEKKIPYAVQLSLAIAAQNDELAHNIIGSALEDIAGKACALAQSYDRIDLPFVIVAMKVATNALETVCDDEGKAFADMIFERTDSIVVDASELREQAKEGDIND